MPALQGIAGLKTALQVMMARVACIAAAATLQRHPPMPTLQLHGQFYHTAALQECVALQAYEPTKGQSL